MITIAIIITNIIIIIILTIIIIITIIIIFRSAESQNEESALFVAFSPPRSPFSSQFSTVLESQSITHYVLLNVKAHSAILYKQRCYKYHQHPTLM